MRLILTLSIATFALLALAPAARADVVSPPPDSCVNGAEPSTCHGSSYCKPLVCQTNADCQNDAECVDRSFCANTNTCSAGYPKLYEVETVADTCSSASDCNNGSVCKSLKVCVSPGCGCRFASSPGDLGGVTLAIGAIIGLVLRRRMPRRLVAAAHSSRT